MAKLGRAIVQAMTDHPFQFFARGLLAPPTSEDLRRFRNPAQRLGFYVKQFVLTVTEAPPTEMIVVLAKGPQSDDPGFMPALQADLQRAIEERGSPAVILEEQTMRNCLLLQKADLVAGCLTQLNSPGANINKVDLAVTFNEVLGRTNQRFRYKEWRWRELESVAEKA